MSKNESLLYKPLLAPNMAGAPSVHISQIFFQSSPTWSKNAANFSIISTAVVLVSNAEQNRILSFMSFSNLMYSISAKHQELGAGQATSVVSLS